jgi:predicted dinucleotide-binding enzyme
MPTSENVELSFQFLFWILRAERRGRCFVITTGASRPQCHKGTDHAEANPFIYTTIWRERPMKIGIIGSGIVGQTLGAKLVAVGEDVVLGTRSPDKLDEKRGMGAPLGEWLKATGNKGRLAKFSDAGAHGEIVINATHGMASLDALKLAGDKNLSGKILIDVSNPLDFSRGFPPTLSVCNDDSLAEQIQRAFPTAKVVKTLNTMTALVMVDPEKIGGGDHDVFISGNDAAAKARVTELLKRWFGWRSVIDLGDITTARGAEMILPIWVRLLGMLGTPMFNFKIVR